MNDRFTTILISSILIVILCIASVNAHPPSNLLILYNPDNILNVTITHQVADVIDHHIKAVTIGVDGKQKKTYEYTSQPDLNEFTYSYPVLAEKGSTVQVTAECNKFGSLTRSITIGGGVTGPTGNPVTSSSTATGIRTSVQAAPSPGFTPALVILSIIFIIGLIYRLKN